MAQEERFPSYGQATPDALEALRPALQRERAWYKDTVRYATNYDIGQAIMRKALVKVDATDDIQPIGRFRNESDLHIPYLSPRAKRMITDLGNLWRVTLWQFGVQDVLDRLAITSMVRSQKRQDVIVADGGLGVPDSTHVTGNAVDVDVSGYYRLDEYGRMVAHGHEARRERHLDVSKKIGREPAELGPYDPRVTDAAIHAAGLLHKAGLINRVHEFPGTSNACLHLAVAPDYPDSIAGIIDPVVAGYPAPE